ncbi:cytochrome c oxidase assembly factor 6 homolog [Onthophagus taurus]|uniref:cytochrome c oxidase assembly factor 6 homolog n=1 Tax=Onthophagus taurus TaxID=166361 RepID=UPI000C2096FF|nr:cytochrome c oxidase assembly factor 6 homolog isoform X2 [Onthophagus taurus]
MSFPSREERAKCWGARDQYWECLDKNQIGDSAKDGPCAQFRKMYEQSCSGQWVKHFDRKRNYLKYKEKIEKDGYEPLESEK